MTGMLRDYLSEGERDYILGALEACTWQIGSCVDALGSVARICGKKCAGAVSPARRVIPLSRRRLLRELGIFAVCDERQALAIE